MAPAVLTMAACRAKLSEFARRVGWVGHCLRQLDHVAAQRVRRTHQWLAFNNRIWPGFGTNHYKNILWTNAFISREETHNVYLVRLHNSIAMFFSF
jgi:hypothetical protein